MATQQNFRNKNKGLQTKALKTIYLTDAILKHFNTESILKITPMYTHFAIKYIFKLGEYKSMDQKQLISNIKTTFQRTPKTL